MTIMEWHVYLAHFLGGALLANALPHLMAGISGQSFPSPFASPPFVGLSPPTVNVAWSLVNLAIAYLLLVRVGPLDLRYWPDAGACFVGFALMAFQCARSLRRLGARVLPLAALTGIASCHLSTEPEIPVVQFTMRSETCGGPIPFSFSIDGVAVGTETLRDTESSGRYESAPGERSVRAVIVGGAFQHDTTATLRHGQTLVVVLAPYCS